MVDEKRVGETGVIRSASVARFSSVVGYAAAAGRPVGVRRQLHGTTRAMRAPFPDRRG